MKKIYNFINKYKKEILFFIIIIILLIVIIYFYYRENFISEGFTGSTTVTYETGWNPDDPTDYEELLCSA